MRFRFNRAFTPLEISRRDTPSLMGFTLLEVLVAVAILSTAIIFILRSFTVIFSSARLGQSISLACYLAEDKLWRLEQRQKKSAVPLEAREDREELQGRAFNWNYEMKKIEDSSLKELRFNVSWQEKDREKEHTITFLTYL